MQCNKVWKGKHYDNGFIKTRDESLMDLINLLNRISQTLKNPPKNEK